MPLKWQNDEQVRAPRAGVAVPAGIVTLLLESLAIAIARIEELDQAFAEPDVIIRCGRCGRAVSSPVPAGTTICAWIQCLECVKAMTANAQARAKAWHAAHMSCGRDCSQTCRNCAAQIVSLTRLLVGEDRRDRT